MAYSNDMGETWADVSMPSTLNPQTDCESSILTIAYEGVYMDTHLYTTQPQSPHRQNMTLFHSVDGGKAWKADFLLWKGPSAYSSLALDPDKFKVLCLFECGGASYTEKITLAIFSPLI
jgi:sialidase-1